MEINNLLESSNTYKSMLKDSEKLASKWEASGLLEGIEDNRVKNNMAVILENQAKQIVAEANVSGHGGVANFTAGAGENWAGVALPLVRKVFAQIVAQDFVSVQPMNLPSGLVFYLDFKYGDSVGGRTDGDNIYGNASSASAKMSVDEEVSGGLYGAGKFGYSLKYDVDSLTGTYTTASWKDVGFNQDLPASIAAGEIKKATAAATAFVGEGTGLGLDTTAVGGIYITESARIHGQTGAGVTDDDVAVGTINEYADFDGTTVTIFVSTSLDNGAIGTFTRYSQLQLHKMTDLTSKWQVMTLTTL